MSLTLSVATPREKAEVIFKTCRLFTYGDIPYVNNSIRKNVLK